MKILFCHRGQTLVEYLIIVALVAVGTLGVFRVVSQNLASRFANIAYALQGVEKSARYDQVSQSHYQKKDLSDFFQNAASDK